MKTSRPQRRTDWQLPTGVSRGVWDYAHSAHIAADYDEYFRDTSLFDIDQLVVTDALGDIAGRRVIDLGTGTGRALLPLIQQGAMGVAVDLSRPMLREVLKKSSAAHCVQANLVDLRCFASDQFDHALCLFSTLGMIRGRAHRRRVLAHVRRMLKPGGSLVLHVHNAWRNLLDAGRVRWTLQTALGLLTRRDFELGDKFFPYRGIPNFYLHTFWPREILVDLQVAELQIVTKQRLHPATDNTKAAPKGDFRAGGWILVCRKSADIDPDLAAR